MTDYKTGDVQAAFGVSHETVRIWTKEFQSYLSPNANPDKGRHRSYNASDLRVFSLVASMKGEGKRFEDIHAALASGSRGDLPIVVDKHAVALESTLKMQQAIEMVQALRERLETVEQGKRDLEKQIIRLETQLEYHSDQAEEIKQLNQEIGRLKALLEIERERNEGD